MITILFLLWLVTFRLDLAAQCIVIAWLIASGFYFLWRDERDKIKRLGSLVEEAHE